MLDYSNTSFLHGTNWVFAPIWTWLGIGLGGFGTKGLGTGLDNHHSLQTVFALHYVSSVAWVSCSDKESESHGTKSPIVPACPHQLAPIIRFLCEILLSEQGVAWAGSVTMSHAPNSAHVP